MKRTFRYPLEPTIAQVVVLERWLVMCQQIYNGALQHRRDAWRRASVNITRYAQTRELTQLRADDPEWAAVPSDILRSALARLDHAFKAFFRRCRAGETPGFPRFRSRDRYDSFNFPARVTVGNHVRVPKLGLVRFKLYRPLKGEVLQVAIRRSARRWWVCFSCDLGEAPVKVPVRTAAGIDLGLTSFVAVSDGTTIGAPRFYRKAEQRLGNHQRALSLKKKGSKSRKKQVRVVARAHEKVRDARLDWQRKLAVDLFGKYDLIAYEDLNVRGMSRGHFAKSIDDAGWAQFIGILTVKAESAGRYAIAVDPRGTSQRCSRCGETVRKELSERVHACQCGYTADRDVNAALNIRALGTSVAQAQQWPAEAQKTGSTQLQLEGKDKDSVA